MRFFAAQLQAFLTVILLCLITATAWASSADQYGYGGAQQDNQVSDTRNSANEKISSIFRGIETTASSYDASGSSAAAQAALNEGCRTAIEYAMQTKLFGKISDKISIEKNISGYPGKFLSNHLNELGGSPLHQLCAALQGDEIEKPDLDTYFKKGIKPSILREAIHYGQSFAEQNGIPFLSNLEIETGISERSLVGSITSIQPLWQDKNDQHHIFSQLSWYAAPDTVGERGYRTKYNTYNAGLAYRYLTPDKNYLYGANAFFDYAPGHDHTRMSLGVDARTSQMAVSANRYLPLSNWKRVDNYYEERAAAGWDLQLRGQVPELPSWTGIVKGYQWDGFQEGRKLYGAEASVEYSPVPAMAMRVGVKDESEGSASLEAALRFHYRFDQPQDLQFKQRTELASVADYVYEKVQRENVIRVKQRRSASSKLTVIETTGANTALEATGSSSLHVGKTLLMPVTVTTANTVGAIGRLLFADGSTLTLGQGTQVLISPTLITLTSGVMQYVSQGTIQTVVVPGGTVHLHGTDIDIVSDGTDSSVRVRDGSVTFTGSSSGSADLDPLEMAESVSGVVGTLSEGSADYVSHADEVSRKIDRIADAQTGDKVAPYPVEAPRIVSQNLTPGQQIVIGLRFNAAVTVSGGTPTMEIDINGNTRTVSLSSGSGTSDLRFAYTVQVADAGATSLLVKGLDRNGATIMGGGKDAVFTIYDKTLALTGSVSDTTAPSGYSITFITDPINNGNKASATLRVNSAEVGTTYNYSISSSGGGTAVTGTGTISSTTHNITGINLTGLGDGTLTASLTLTDVSSNVGSATTDTVAKDTSTPSGYAAAFTTTPITDANKTAAAFNITSAEVGAGFSYSISSSGGGAPVTGTGTISAATHSVSGVNLSSLPDGTLTVSVTLTDTSGNAGSAATSTSAKDATAPTGYNPVFTTNPINNSNKSAAAFNITGAEVGATFSYSISSSGGGTPVTGTGTISAGTHSVTGIDLSGLSDGTFTVSVTLTDTSGNAGSAVTGTTGADTVAPSGYGISFLTTPVNNGNKTAASIRISSAEVGTTYNYSISSSGGGTAVTGTATIATSTTDISSINLSGLADGTLTASVTLTDSSSNAGSAVTATATKDIVAPSGYAAVFTTVPVSSGNVTSAAFNITGAEVGAGFSYSISSSGGGTPVTGTGTISGATESISSLDLSGLSDGTLTVSVTLTDTAGNAGSTVTGTTTMDVAAPSGYTVNFTTDPVNGGNYTAAAFSFAGAEVGSTYSYSISSSGGGAAVTGTGTIATATDSISGLVLTGLSDGTLTLSVTLTDTSGNVGSAATDTVTKDIVIPTITSVTAVDGTYEP